MPSPAAKRLFSTEEFERMGRCGILRDDDRVELIEGEVVTRAPIGSEHAGLVDRIAHRLHREFAGETILRVQNPIRLGERSEPQPDLAVVRYRDDFYTTAHPGPEDIFLIIEVGEASLDYDRNVKLPLYAEWSIPAVWLVNLPDRRLEVFEAPQEGRYRRHHITGPGEHLQLPGATTFQVPVRDLYPEAGG